MNSGNRERNGLKVGSVERWAGRVQWVSYLPLLMGALAVSPSILWPALGVFTASSLTVWTCVIRRWVSSV